MAAGVDRSSFGWQFLFNKLTDLTQKVKEELPSIPFEFNTTKFTDELYNSKSRTFYRLDQHAPFEISSDDITANSKMIELAQHIIFQIIGHPNYLGRMTFQLDQYQFQIIQIDGEGLQKEVFDDNTYIHLGDGIYMREDSFLHIIATSRQPKYSQ